MFRPPTICMSLACLMMTSNTLCMFTCKPCRAKRVHQCTNTPQYQNEEGHTAHSPLTYRAPKWKIDENRCTSWYPLHSAAARRDLVALRMLLRNRFVGCTNTPAAAGETALHHASTPETVDLLLEYGANINAKQEPCGDTPLHWAARNKPVYAVVNTLLQRGAGVNTHNSLGETPLHVACENGHTTTIHQLLQAGADIDATSVFGTPLHIAIRHRRMETTQLLLQSGASIEQTPSQSTKQLLHTCAEKCHTLPSGVRILLEYGARIEPDTDTCTHW